MKSALMWLVLTATVLVPDTSAAQEAASPPTPQEVLEGLREGRRKAASAATEILTQLDKRRPRSELDAFADSLVALAIGRRLHGRLCTSGRSGRGRNRTGAWHRAGRHLRSLLSRQVPRLPADVHCASSAGDRNPVNAAAPRRVGTASGRGRGRDRACNSDLDRDGKVEQPCVVRLVRGQLARNGCCRRRRVGRRGPGACCPGAVGSSRPC